jgi:hypothetical protein
MHVQGAKSDSHHHMWLFVTPGKPFLTALRGETWVEGSARLYWPPNSFCRGMLMVKTSVLITGCMLLFSLVTAKNVANHVQQQPRHARLLGCLHFAALLSSACHLHGRRYYMSASFHLQLRSFVDCRLCRDIS